MDRAGGWRVLRPGALERDPGRYSFSWPGPAGLAALGANLGRFGLLRPLLALESGGRQRLVAGHRRLAALETLGVAEVAVRVVAGGDDPEVWDLLLEEHLAARPLNPVELGLYALRRGEATGESQDELAGRVLPRLGLPPRAAALEDPRWIAGLPERHRDAFAEGALPAQGVRVLAQADRGDAVAALDLLAPLRLGVNRFSEVCRLLLECAWAEGQAVAAWCRSQGLDGLGSAEALRADLRRRRYPRLAEWDRTFETDARAAALPPNARISHAPGFEGGRLTLTAQFGSLAELGETLTAVDRAREEGRLAPLERYLG